VMMYVSFVEIFGKSVVALGIAEGESEESKDEKFGYGMGTFFFFLGILAIQLLDWFVHWLAADDELENMSLDKALEGIAAQAENAEEVVDTDSEGESKQNKGAKQKAEFDEEAGLRLNGGSMGGTVAVQGVGAVPMESVAKPGSVLDAEMEKANNSEIAALHKKKLNKMGLMTALAIGIHNFPEGLATFLGTLDDPNVGASLAVSIGIHNIPEGLCVAIPIYYAYGDRNKAFWWAFVSGISEPIGAFIGWLVVVACGGEMSQWAYGVLFGMVAGMMCFIVIKELLPTAYRYDPEDTVVTYSFIAGMIIMALSLVLFVVA